MQRAGNACKVASVNEAPLSIWTSLGVANPINKRRRRRNVMTEVIRRAATMRQGQSRERQS
eukprot:3773082-Pleurochrysis_carterae.AAC.2